jgi:hypothetical protein
MTRKTKTNKYDEMIDELIDDEMYLRGGDLSSAATGALNTIQQGLYKVPGIGNVIKGVADLGNKLAEVVGEKTSKLLPSAKAQQKGIDIFGYNTYLPFEQFPKIQQDVFNVARSKGLNVAKFFPKGGDQLRKYVPDGSEQPEDNPGLSDSELDLPYPSNNVLYGSIVYNKDGSINDSKSNFNNYNQRNIQFAHNKIASDAGY